MKVRSLAVAAGVSAPLILSGPSEAGFVGIYVVSKLDPCDLVVANVYAEFDNQGHDWMLAVAGTANSPLDISVLDGGVFYNHSWGGDTAPDDILVGLFPSLAYDSFYTIGMKVVPSGVTDFLTLVNMPPLEGTSVSTTSAAWSLVPPTAPQGNPFDPINSYPGNGQILIGQFSTSEIHGMTGSFLLQYRSDGVVTTSSVNFELLGDWDFCCADEDCHYGDPCYETWSCIDNQCQWAPALPDCNGNEKLDSCDIDDGTSEDCNGNGVPDECDIDSGTAEDCNVNGVPDQCDIDNGTSTDINVNGIPDECESCPWDCSGDNDGIVGVVDFLALLAQWGGPGTCDFDGGDVHVTDFLEMLANWGPCPLPEGCGDGNCCAANGTPGCQDAACCDLICVADPYCCDEEWDGACADMALTVCDCSGGACGPGGGDCCIANGTPGCEDAQCCADICAVDAYCCDVEWDGSCAEQALALCDCLGGVCGPGHGNCCVANGTPGCDDTACCTTVCASDPWCCDVEWDGQCAALAQSFCDCP